MEMLLAGPLKVVGWFLVVSAVFVTVFNDFPLANGIGTVLLGSGCIWVGRWVSASREARLQRKWARHQGRADRINDI